MLSLAVKDILVQKKSLWSILFYSAFMHFAFSSAGGLAYVAAAIGVAYILINGACAHDAKNNSEVVLISLPLARNKVVMAKYLSAVIFLAFGITGSVVVGALMKISGLPMPKNFIGLEELVGIITGVVLLYSLFFPVIFKIGYMRARYYSTFIFLAIFFLPGFAAGFLQKNAKLGEPVKNFLLTVSTYPDLLIAGVILAAAAAIALISMLISIVFYKNRELA